MTPKELWDLCAVNDVQVPAEVTDEHLLDWLLAEFGV